MQPLAPPAPSAAAGRSLLTALVIVVVSRRAVKLGIGRLDVGGVEEGHRQVRHSATAHFPKDTAVEAVYRGVLCLGVFAILGDHAFRYGLYLPAQCPPHAASERSGRTSSLPFCSVPTPPVYSNCRDSLNL